MAGSEQSELQKDMIPEGRLETTVISNIAILLIFFSSTSFKLSLKPSGCTYLIHYFYITSYGKIKWLIINF